MKSHVYMYCSLSAMGGGNVLVSKYYGLLLLSSHESKYINEDDIVKFKINDLLIVQIT